MGKEDLFTRRYNSWKKKGCQTRQYIDELFDLVFEKVLNNTNDDLLKAFKKREYKSLFIPVGYSIGNVLISACLIQPENLTLAFTDSAKGFHSEEGRAALKDKIKDKVPGIKIKVAKNIKSDDQFSVANDVRAWIENEKNAYGNRPNKLAIDLTGGTKPISIGAQNAALSFSDIDAFYISCDFDMDFKPPIPKPGSEQLIRLVKGPVDIEKDFVFVIMPFDKSYNKLYKWIKEVLEACGKSCIRSDKEYYLGEIMQRVRENIYKSEYLVAVLTGCNSNVFYELGIAHTAQKRVLSFIEEGHKLPFDIHHLRAIYYMYMRIKFHKKKLK